MISLAWIKEKWNDVSAIAGAIRATFSSSMSGLDQDAQVALASHPALGVRRDLAATRPLHPEAVRKLIHDPDTIISNHVTPLVGEIPGLALECAQSEDPGLQRMALYQNFIAPGVAETLVNSKHPQIREQLASKNISPEIMHRLLDTAEHNVRDNQGVLRTLAVNGSIDEESAKRLLAIGSTYHRHSFVTYNLGAWRDRPDIQRILAQDPESSIVETFVGTALHYGLMTPDILHTVASSFDPHRRAQIAKVATSLDQSPEFLARFVHDPSPDVRMAFASGIENWSHLTPELQLTLAKDPACANVVVGLSSHHPPEIVAALSEQILKQSSGHAVEGLVRQRNIQPDVVRAIVQRWTQPDRVFQSENLLYAIASRNTLPADMIPTMAAAAVKLGNQGDDYIGASVANALLDRPDISADVLQTLSVSNNANIRAAVAAHANAPTPLLQGMVEGETSEQVLTNIRRALAFTDPSVRGTPIQVRLGTHKLRMIRDLIRSNGKTEMRPKDLPAGNWAVGRLKNGNISADKLQEHIDSLQPRDFFVTEGIWGGGQQHTDESSNVFQLNASQAQLETMEKEGLLPLFRRMIDNTSGHPLGPAGLGWIRWTGDKRGIHIDEVQTDFGVDWALKRALEARQYGDDENEARANAEKEWPSAGQQRIREILFGGEAPAHVFMEAFQEWLRHPRNVRTCPHCNSSHVGVHNPDYDDDDDYDDYDDERDYRPRAICNDCGHGDYPENFNEDEVSFLGTPIHIWQLKPKTSISLNDESRPPPGHFRHTYQIVPHDKMGWREGEYGQLPTQSNESHKRNVIREGDHYVKDCPECGGEMNLDHNFYPAEMTCTQCKARQPADGARNVGTKVTFHNADPTWAEEVRKFEEPDEDDGIGWIDAA